MVLQDEYVKTARMYLSKSPQEQVEFLAQAKTAARAIEKVCMQSVLLPDSA